MQALHLELLGSPYIRLGEQPLVGFTTMKAQALLIYLAVNQRVHSRDALAGMFWHDMPDRQAKKNLRNALPNLRSLVGSHLTITRHSVAFNRASPYYLDVENFRAALASPHRRTNLEALKDATTLYRDDFLASFYVRGAAPFEEWALMEREHLRAIAIDGLLALAEQCIKQQDYSLGLAATKRLLMLDPWREIAYQHQMLLLVYSGQRNAALAQYNACRTMLAEELDVEPMEETTALYKQIKADAVPSARVITPAAYQADTGVGSPVDWTEFPQRAPFYGRCAELAQLHQWLTAEKACLVGIFGLASQGKTTLAAHLAWALAEERPVRQRHSSVEEQGFARIIWCSPSNAASFTAVLQGWLSFLSDRQIIEMPTHVDEQLTMLFDYLQQQRCLLILDHVERILHDDSANGMSGGMFRPGYEAYELLMHQINRRVHRSCLVLLSRERPMGFDALDTAMGGVRSLLLRGLSPDASEQLLHEQGISGSRDALQAVIARYAGHPLTLKFVAATVKAFFASDLEAFLSASPLIFEDMRHILDPQFATLSRLEKEILLRLAVHQEPVLFQALWVSLNQSPSQRDLLEALRDLQRRCLLETGPDGFRLHPMVTAYVTTHMRAARCQEQPEETRSRLIANGVPELG